MKILSIGILTIKSKISLNSLFNSLVNHTSVEVSCTNEQNEQGLLDIRFDTTTAYNRGTWTGFITVTSHNNETRKCTCDTSSTISGFIFEK